MSKGGGERRSALAPEECEAGDEEDEVRSPSTDNSGDEFTFGEDHTSINCSKEGKEESQCGNYPFGNALPAGGDTHRDGKESDNESSPGRGEAVVDIVPLFVAFTLAEVGVSLQITEAGTDGEESPVAGLIDKVVRGLGEVGHDPHGE